jgi:allantoin racemase
MRICVVHIDSDSTHMARIITEVGRKVLRPDTELGFKSVKTGLGEIRDYYSSYFNLLNKSDIVNQFIEAEKEGYEAAMVDCFEDPGVAEAREIVNIPIVGPGETALLMGCLFGQKLGFVNLNEPKLFPKNEEFIRKNGLWDRAVTSPVRGISISTLKAFSRGWLLHNIITDAVDEKAQELIRDGANVVIVSCCGLGPICTLGGLSRARGTEVPILDPIAISLKTAEMLAELTNKLGLPATSRSGIWASPSKEDLERVRKRFGMGQ